jgi:hypothetical protein
VRRRAFAQLASVLIGIVAITGYVHPGTRIAIRWWSSAPDSQNRAASPRELGFTSEKSPKSDAGAAPAQTEPSHPAQEKSSDSSVSTPVMVSQAVSPSPPSPLPSATKQERAAVAAAEANLDAASRDRARAEDRAAAAAHHLATATSQASLDVVRARKLAFQLRDPSTRIAQASARGGFLRGQRDRLATELATLRSRPRPKSTSILSKSPVAKPATEDEFHFELRRGRISFIDLNRLLDLTKADAQVRIRMSDRLGVISSKVGPVGAFSLAYVLAPSSPNSMEELIERRNIRRFDLKGWELIAEFENRGETYESTQNPISEFTRAVNRINPNRATITLWIYPDSFTLYGRIRNDLVERGFSVAARPLPEGLAIRGSPMGTQSAAQ